MEAIRSSETSGTTQPLHGVISQKKILFKTTAVNTSNPTKYLMMASTQNM
jgi:hypothetical protein